MSKKTPLYHQHIQLDAKIHEFAGYDLPIEYSGILAEHAAVRSAAGLFDVSHMGEIECRGPGATAFLQQMTTNDVGRLVDGKAQYSLFLNERGGIIDDIIVYRFAAEHYIVVVNAGNAETDWHWLIAHQPSNATLKNRSDEFALIALQGPRAVEILQPLVSTTLSGVKPFHFIQTTMGHIPVIAARTGYTGEDGFELFVPAKEAPSVWSSILDAGKPAGLVPCGLGARDTLRIEMGYRLHGHDVTDKVTPLEGGLEWVVKFEKGDFVGRDMLLKQQKEGLKRALVAFKMLDPCIPREGHSIVSNHRPVGYVTSGTHSPSLKKGIGLGYVPADSAAPGTKFSVDIRGRERLAEIVKPPFYKKNF